MGKQRAYRVWLPEEEEALRLGVQKHGLGAWEQIRTDDAFPSLSNRTGVQLKDKWRNLVKFKHLSKAETACLASKTQRPAWKAEDFGEEGDRNSEEDGNSGRYGSIPSVATCCQQEIHATLLAREAHNIQIEANKALAAALAAVDREVDGSDELMRNSVYVATQASEKAMKAKQHVVLARRRLGMALLAAEKELTSEEFMQPLGDAIGGIVCKTEADVSICSNGSTHEVHGAPRQPVADHESDDNSKHSEDMSEVALNKTLQQPSKQTLSAKNVVCPCGTDLAADGLRLCACSVCGNCAHEECLIIQATTQGKNFSKPYTCKTCNGDDSETPKVLKGQNMEKEAECSAAETHTSDLSPAKRKASMVESEDVSKRKCITNSSEPTPTPCQKLADNQASHGGLADKICSLQANLEALPTHTHVGADTPGSAAINYAHYSPSPAASMCSSLPVECAMKEAHKIAAPLQPFNESGVEIESHLLENMLKEMSYVSEVDFGKYL